VFSDLDSLLADHTEIQIVHGACPKGADWFAHQWFQMRLSSYALRLSELRFPANWEKHGKAAGFRRNVDMAHQSGAHHCLAYWDGVSPGTMHMIGCCAKHGIDVTITAPKRGKGRP
jgi:hypothetical protein